VIGVFVFSTASRTALRAPSLLSIGHSDSISGSRAQIS
jgi:hypothetical protein